MPKISPEKSRKFWEKDGRDFSGFIPENPDPGKIPDGPKIRDFGIGIPENPAGIPSRAGP
jgi:hypothetical protein